MGTLGKRRRIKLHFQSLIHICLCLSGKTWDRGAASIWWSLHLWAGSRTLYLAQENGKTSLLYQVCSRDTEFLHDNEVSRIVTRGQECAFGSDCAGVSAGCGQTHTRVPEWTPAQPEQWNLIRCQICWARWGRCRIAVSATAVTGTAQKTMTNKQSYCPSWYCSSCL